MSLPNRFRGPPSIWLYIQNVPDGKIHLSKVAELTSTVTIWWHWQVPLSSLAWDVWTCWGWRRRGFCEALGWRITSLWRRRDRGTFQGKWHGLTCTCAVGVAKAENQLGQEETLEDDQNPKSSIFPWGHDSAPFTCLPTDLPNKDSPPLLPTIIKELWSLKV